MAAFLVEAIKGVKVRIRRGRQPASADQGSFMQAEMEVAGTLPRQLARLPTVLGILLKEVAALLNLIPYAITTQMLYRYEEHSFHSHASASGAAHSLLRSLPRADKSSNDGGFGVAILRDVAYGSGERTVLDIYVPSSRKEALPVVFFVHGGVWASGEKW